MNRDKLVRSLRLQLWLERAAILLVALFFFGRWGIDHFQARPYAILADGKPVAYVATEQEASRVLDKQRKNIPGVKPSEVVFAEQVTIVRASESRAAMSEAEAVAQTAMRLHSRVRKWAILVNDVPVVAVSSKDDAGSVLEAAKQRFGSIAKNLAEEPQFKERVNVEEMPVAPAIYKPDTAAAVHELLSGGGAGSGVYVVTQGDLAGTVAHRFHVKLDELKALNPGVNLDKLHIGQKLLVSKGGASSGKPHLTVVVRDQATKTEQIPFRTLTVSSYQMNAGKQLVVSPGKNGLRRVTVATTYENGVKTSFEVVDESVIRNPVSRQIAVGVRTHR